MMNQGQEIVVYPSRTKLVGFVLGSLAFVVLGVLFAVYREEMEVSTLMVVICSYIGVPFFGLIFLFSLKKLLWPTPAVVINAEGIFDDASLLGGGMIRWEEIGELVPYEYSGSKMLGVVPKNPEMFLFRQSLPKRMFMRLNMKMAPAPIAIPQAILPMSVDDLLLRIKEFYQPQESNLGKPHLEPQSQGAETGPERTRTFAGKPPWKPDVAAVVCFLLGPIAGGIVSYLSLKRLGSVRKARWTLGLTLLLTPVLVFAVYPQISNSVAVGLNIGLCFAFRALQEKEFALWKSRNPELEAAKWWKSIGWGFVGLVGLVLLVLVGAVGAVLVEETAEIKDVEVALSVPESVTVGQEFEFVILVNNTAQESQLFHSVDISERYLAGIDIKRTEPAFTESSRIPFIDFRSYVFEQEIPAGGQAAVKFIAVAKEQGEFWSEINVCINSEINCATHLLRTVVEEN
jgi:hypothetical protein